MQRIRILIIIPNIFVLDLIRRPPTDSVKVYLPAVRERPLCTTAGMQVARAGAAGRNWWRERLRPGPRRIFSGLALANSLADDILLTPLIEPHREWKRSTLKLDELSAANNNIAI